MNRSDKIIVVEWIPEKDYGFGRKMRIIESSHEKFVNGSLLDIGQFRKATDEGYVIISLPNAPRTGKIVEGIYCNSCEVFMELDTSGLCANCNSEDIINVTLTEDI